MAEKWANKDALFKSPRKKERHTIDGIGDVWIYSLSCGEKDQYETDAYEVMAGSREVRMLQARALLIARSVRDQHGNLFFAEKELGRIAAMDSWITEPIYNKARRLSRMTAADISELVKNSEMIRSEDSGSGSPTPEAGPSNE